jgi:hypothetical protein
MGIDFRLEPIQIFSLAGVLVSQLGANVFVNLLDNARLDSLKLNYDLLNKQPMCSDVDSVPDDPFSSFRCRAPRC